MITRKDIERHYEEREAMDEYIDKLGREYAEKQGKPIPADGNGAFTSLENWEIWSNKLSITYRESWQGGWGDHTISIPLNELEGEQ
jgi:hypothetical protein